ncbi:MAG: hypothetical protein AUJ52_06175 [Elusimicrobia bacterium CG1_02_63_36]|nr:MAG: hypothetical protein AUJ52_06175 [Elusimicrobia bacterium CG1_02_63_36]PIP84863.1 MAG: hypothetical protein COR54_01860 [Elusimicrobia bacterium CG22_combo_CG10-13_8_21_14_all_63_91]PJA11710.1 MAG: hypothetical protein COX66_19145 [Elusimicrobia bacterium CG_4_10_14_0_2_um_filter_63_34]PJB23262.1 MAG: hypothetical protein CO113_18725 [Elusimicrobia bacterium CG_4_9_14_3_um_filter_62_55]
MNTPDRETELLERLQTLRWKDGLRCPRCGNRECSVHSRGAGRRKLRCAGCGRTFTDLTGTALARSHLTLGTWAEAAKMVAEGKPTCSDLSVRLKVRLATAWRMRKILKEALKDENLRQVLIDGGKR